MRFTKEERQRRKALRAAAQQEHERKVLTLRAEMIIEYRDQLEKLRGDYKLALKEIDETFLTNEELADEEAAQGENFG